MRRQISRTRIKARDAETDTTARDGNVADFVYPPNDSHAPIDVGIAMTIYGRDRKGKLIEIPGRAGDAASVQTGASITGAPTRH